VKDKILHKLYHGFVQLHILHHAGEKPIYGTWMMDELTSHGYHIGPGTLYPLLKNMEKSGLLRKQDRLVNGRIRKYYAITPLGIEVFQDAAKKASQLFHEIEGSEND